MRSAHPHVQALLVQAAWRVCRSTDPRVAALRAWGQTIAGRRGRRSRLWRSPDGWRALSMRCGAMVLTISRLAFERIRGGRRATPTGPVEPPRNT